MSNRFRVGARVEILPGNIFSGDLNKGYGTITRLQGDNCGVRHDSYCRGNTWTFPNRYLRVLVTPNVIGGKLL